MNAIKEFLKLNRWKVSFLLLVLVSLFSPVLFSQAQINLGDDQAFNQKLVDWLLWYNTKRPHSSLNNKSPIQYLIETLGFSRMLWAYALA